MNKVQLAILWIGGLCISAVISLTGLKLLAHAAANPEMWANGYPLTVLAGTAWAYIAPIAIIGLLLIYSFKK